MPDIDEKQLKQLLRQIETHPDPEWVETTTQRLQLLVDPDVQQASAGFGWLRYMTGFVLMLFVGVFGLNYFTGFDLLSSLTQYSDVKTIALSDTEKNDLLDHIVSVSRNTNILERISQDEDPVIVDDQIQATDTTDSPSQTTNSNTGNGSGQSQQSSPSTSSNHFLHSSVTNQPGAALASCPALQKQVGTLDAYSYVELDGDIFTKTSHTNQSGQLTNYYLLQDGNGLAQAIDYRGGEYSIKYPYSFTPPLVSGVPLAGLHLQNAENCCDDWIDQYDISEIVNEGGVDYYLVVYDTQVNCGTQTQPVSKNLITVDWVHENSYRIVRREYYINSRQPGSLVMTSNADIQVDDRPYSQASSVFNYDQGAPQRLVSAYADVSNIDKLIDYLSVYRVVVLAPTGEYSLTAAESIVTSDQGADAYISDRSFYPAGDLGDDMFKDAVGDYGGSQPMARFTYDVDDADISLNIYPKQVDDTAIIANVGISPGYVQLPGSVVINTRHYQAKLFINDSGGGNAYLLVKYGGAKFLIVGNEVDEISYLSLSPVVDHSQLSGMLDQIW